MPRPDEHGILPNCHSRHDVCGYSVRQRVVRAQHQTLVGEMFRGAEPFLIAYSVAVEVWVVAPVVVLWPRRLFAGNPTDPDKKLAADGSPGKTAREQHSRDHDVSKSTSPIDLQAHLHHQYFVGLQLMVAVEEGKEVVGDWMFRLFRQQHIDKFLPSFEKLGLNDLPHAVACAKYHALSNAVGGVRVEFMEESDKKAWVRFRYPRWMYFGPAVCGIPHEASLGFLNGWYAQNGVSLDNPRLGFVCVSEDLTGEYGLCGYFKEHDHDLTPGERLQFATGEVPPPFDPAKQPSPPDVHWSEERLAKGGRNYAIEYCRNGICQLVAVVGRDRALELGKRTARLTGLQQFRHLAELIGCEDGDHAEAARFLAVAFEGMGDEVAVRNDGNKVVIVQRGLRIARGMGGEDRANMLACWVELWRGAVDAQRTFKTIEVEDAGEALVWAVSMREAA